MTAKCSGDAFFVVRDETTMVGGRGGDGGGSNVGLGPSNLQSIIPIMMKKFEGKNRTFSLD